MTTPDAYRNLRENLHGLPSLTARLEPWMVELLADGDACRNLVDAYGSPVNVLNSEALRRNACELVDAGREHGVDVRVFVARKANKALGVVDAAREAELGIDVGSEPELKQVLARGVDPRRIILTAAVKPASVLRLCLQRGVPIALDNLDEAELFVALASEMGDDVLADHPTFLRLAPGAGLSPTRFGESTGTWLTWLNSEAPRPTIRGLHFHLHGYAAKDRVAALRVALETVDELREVGHPVDAIDIGGGIPMSYLDGADGWKAFWRRRRTELVDAAKGTSGEPNTWRNHGLGLSAARLPNGEWTISGSHAVYPAYQNVTRGAWLDEVLSADGIAEGLTSRGLRLHCEPGRSVLDGCGVTLARVEFRKRTSDGVCVVGLAMNRTQVRSAADDFLLDPILLRIGNDGGYGRVNAKDAPRRGAFEGFLVGAYCIEAELLSFRRFAFPNGVGVGDIVAFPNTAGYMMHILESASHQFPLAKNVWWDGQNAVLDAIDHS